MGQQWRRQQLLDEVLISPADSGRSPDRTDASDTGLRAEQIQRRIDVDWFIRSFQLRRCRAFNRLLDGYRDEGRVLDFRHSLRKAATHRYKDAWPFSCFCSCEFLASVS